MNLYDDMPLGDEAQDAASSQPTDDGGFDSDAMLDPPIQNIGDLQEIGYGGKIKKEIMEIGDGVKKPKLNYLVNVIYKGYFFDHTEFDSSNDLPVQIALGDISWPEGLWKAIEEMRQGEKSKIKIKHKFGFGRKENVDKLRFPAGYEVEGEKREKLMKKGIIYEVKLLDWIERIDIEANGNLLKTFINKPSLKEWERPSEIDEITCSIQAYYDKDQEIFFNKENWQTTMSDPELTMTYKKILESCKRGEHSIVQVKSTFIGEEDQQLFTFLGDKFEVTKDLTVEVQLMDYVKTEDWFKDQGTCKKRTLRKGKAFTPNIDSTIKVRMRITVNDKVVLNNFGEGDPKELYNQLNMSDEDKQNLIQDDSLYTLTLDKYNMPSLLLKVLKSMKNNEVCEFIATSHYDKLKSNFINDYFDQYQLFNEGDRISFLICLVDIDKTTYFYQLTVAAKLARVQGLKNTAGQFFKVENYKKAAKIYQKINGYFNFGDVDNNHAQEDEKTEEYIKTKEDLKALKVTSFMNLVVCKYKSKEYQSIIGITDQVIEMDPNSVKCWYFRGKAYTELKDYDSSVKCFQRLMDIDPQHKDGKIELQRAKQIKKKHFDDEHKKYSKFFS